VFFRVLKSGCRVEGRRFEHIDRLLPCLAVYVIVAWRTMMVCRMGRSCPDIDCEAIFEPAEWKAVYMVVKRESPPKQPPRLEEIIRLIGQLGGWVNRPNRKDLPGVQTIWLGLQRMHDLASAWVIFGPGASQEVV
jgi:Transposase Tn5 dimerisation domain